LGEASPQNRPNTRKEIRRAPQARASDRDGKQTDFKSPMTLSIG
jgi:hypothetical protein